MTTPGLLLRHNSPLFPRRSLANRAPTGAKRSRTPSSNQSRTTASSSSSSSLPTPPPSPFRNPLQWYAEKLDTHPLLTKGITSGLISGSGDILCQYLSSKNDTSSECELEESNNDDTTNNDNNQSFIDWKRSLRFTALGSFLVAPTVHLWYGMLMTRIPGNSASVVAKRLFFDQGCFAPIFTSTFISCLTVLEHVSPNDADKNDTKDIITTKKQTQNIPQKSDGGLLEHIQTRLENDVPDAILVGWSMWVPSMGFMFAFVPSKFQVLFSNGVGFVWNAYLSWRTHEGEEGH